MPHEGHLKDMVYGNDILLAAYYAFPVFGLPHKKVIMRELPNKGGGLIIPKRTKKKKRRSRKKSRFGADPWLRNVRRDDIMDKDL
jgi:hypothetical protein